MDWHLKRKLRARPVVTGQVLVNIADSGGDWELELLMPEKRMKYIDDALAQAKKDTNEAKLPVEFILSTSTGVDRAGVLHKESINDRATLDPEDGAVVKMRVVPDPIDDQKLYPGAKVIADVNCGKASAAYVWSHEVIEWVQANILF